MPVMNRGTPLGESRRWPSSEVAACAGAPVTTTISAATVNAHRTATRLTTRSGGELPAAAEYHVPQCVIHGLQREVRFGHAEPEPVLVSVCVIRPLPEPDKSHP